MERVSILEFSDYRAYLLAYVQDAKQANPRWTVGAWVRKLGLKDTSSMTKILQGHRHPGPTITRSLVKHFCFSSQESDYFRELIRFQRLKGNSKIAVQLIEQAAQQFPKGALRVLDQDEFALLSQWYCFAIREMVKLSDFQEDPIWISRKLRFKVTPKEVAQAIQLLLQARLLKRNRQGQLRITATEYSTSNDFASEAIRRYHSSMLKNADLALSSIPVEEREFSSTTFTMKREKLATAKKLITEFRTELSKLLEEDGGDQTVQIQIQLFPLTKDKPVKTQSRSKEPKR